MFILQLTLGVKILLTLGLWSLPLLLRPEALVKDASPSAHFLARSLGATNLALFVMYVFGLVETFDGVIPWFAVGAGLCSNGIGALLSIDVLRSNSATGSHRTLTMFNVIALASITVGLVLGSSLAAMGF